MHATDIITDRVKLEIKVLKGLLGYPGSPSQYYVAIVGSGPQLGNENPVTAPRCKRIGNNVWMKEIWVPKEKLVCFKFLVVHGPTNSVYESEVIPPRHVYVDKDTVIAETRFNETRVKDERGVCIYGLPEETRREIENNAVTEVEQELEENGKAMKENGQTLKENGQAMEEDGRTARHKEKQNNQDQAELILKKCRDSPVENLSGSCSNTDHADSKGLDNSGGGGSSDTRKITYVNEIRQKIKLEKVLLDRGDMLRLQLGVHETVFERFDLRPKSIEKIALGIGLQPIQTLPKTSDGFFHQQLWLPKDKIGEFLFGKNDKKYKLRIKDSGPMRTANRTVTKPYATEHSALMMKNGAAIHKTVLFKTGEITPRRDKSLRPILTGNVETLFRTPPHAICRYRPDAMKEKQPYLERRQMKLFCSLSSDGAYLNKTLNRALVSKSRKEIELRPIITGYLAAATVKTRGATMDTRSSISDDTYHRQHVIVNEIKLSNLSESKVEHEVNPDLAAAGDAKDTELASQEREHTEDEIEKERNQLEEVSCTWKLPFSKKGLLIIGAGVAIAACLKSFFV